MPIYDPEAELCEDCQDNDTYCRFCGAPCDDDECESCQELLDNGDLDAVLDEEDEEYLRGPYNR
jgi:hypothetical protein